MKRSRMDRRTAPQAFTLLTLALLTLTLLAGCDSAAPEEDLEAADLEAEGPLWGDPGVSLEAAVRQDAAGAAKTGERAHWADGYVWANDPTSSPYTPFTTWTFNRTGGPVEITRPAGTTGRYRVRFSGLSHLIGATHIVKVTAWGPGNTYCKPNTPKLKNDVVEIRCYNAVTGAATNSHYSVLVTQKYTDVAYAFANKPAGNNYAPAAPTAWNPAAGAIRVFRDGVGVYRVQFNGLGTHLDATGSGGNAQVTAVGSDKNYCSLWAWYGSPDLTVYVRCFNQAGAPIDAKFNTIVFAPSSPLGYVWAHSSTTPSYTPSGTWAYNSGGGGLTITRSGVGTYQVTFNNPPPGLLDGGNAQVTAHGTGNVHCNLTSWGTTVVELRCFLPNGSPTDSNYSLLLGS